MIDVVTNNMAYAGAGSDVDFSSFTPFNKKEYFHDLCQVTNYSDPQNAQEVRLLVPECSPITYNSTVLAGPGSGLFA